MEMSMNLLLEFMGLPESWRGIHVFDVDGIEVFPVYGQSGGLTIRKVSYLCRAIPESEEWEYLPFWYEDDGGVCLQRALAKWPTDKRIGKKGCDLGLPQP
jgi:hypothetical protein